MVERDWFYCCFYCLTQAACRAGPGAKTRESRQFSSRHKVHLTAELKFQVASIDFHTFLRFNVPNKDDLIPIRATIRHSIHHQQITNSQMSPYNSVQRKKFQKAFIKTIEIFQDPFFHLKLKH